jgi:hypothetical protein
MSFERTTGILNVGKDFGRSFRLREAPSLLLASKSRPQMAVTRITVPTGLSEPAGPVLPERGFTIPVYLRQPLCQDWGTWVDGKFLPVAHWAEGGIGIYDLESNPRAWRTSAYDCVHFNLPRATLDAFTSDNDLPPIENLICTQGKRDDLLFGLAKFILPWLGHESRVCDLTFDYFVLMFCSHVATTYGSLRLSRRQGGGLASWQRRRVVELINTCGGMPPLGESFFPLLQAIIRCAGTSLPDPMSGRIRQVAPEEFIDAFCRNCASMRIQRSSGL